MHRSPSRAGFTLVELLVVIAVISVLAAILFPVFSRTREKARQTKCQSHLTQLVTALKEFRTNEGHYPPAPYYDVTDPANPRYEGGFSALYPDYVTDRDLFICPDDRKALDNLGGCRDRVYCSYNGLIDWVDVDTDGSTWEFLPLTSGGQGILYNYFGYTYSCELLTDGDENCGPALAGYSSGYDTDATLQITPARVQGVPPALDLTDLDDDANGIPDFLDVARLSWQHFPALANRSAPDYTIVTHCPHHRRYFGDSAAERDIIATLGGQTSLGNVTDLGDPTKTGVPDPAVWPGARPVAGWVHQNF